MKPYRLTADAREDLRETWGFIAERDSRTAADRVLTDIRGGFRRIAEVPGIGRRREDLGLTEHTVWTVHSWYILYDPTSTPLTILRILSAHRDIPRVLDEG